MANYIKTLKDENEKLKAEVAELQKQRVEREANERMPEKDPEAPAPALDVEQIPVEKESVLSGRPPTKPWNSKDGAYRPHRRDMFALKKKDPNWHPRFVSPENVERRQDMGYRIADPAKYGGLADNVIDDGSPMGRRIVRRGMILMERPMADVQAQMQYEEKVRQQQRRRSREEVKEEARKEFEGTGHQMVVTDDTHDE